MAHTAYICRLRTDIPAGAIQWTDVRPNTSQRSLVFDAAGQTGYLGDRVANDTLAALVANATVAEYSGLAAYLIDHVIDGVTGVTITVAVANASAAAIVAQLDSQSDIDVSTALLANGVANAGAGTALSSGGSNGTLKDILKILSGGLYILPSGSVVGNLAAGAALGSFTNDSEYRQMYSTGSLQLSCGEGQLAGFAAASFSYDGTAGAALAVYDHQGTSLA